MFKMSALQQSADKWPFSTGLGRPTAPTQGLGNGPEVSISLVGKLKVEFWEQWVPSSPQTQLSYNHHQNVLSILYL